MVNPQEDDHQPGQPCSEKSESVDGWKIPSGTCIESDLWSRLLKEFFKLKDTKVQNLPVGGSASKAAAEESPFETDDVAAGTVVEVEGDGAADG